MADKTLVDGTRDEVYQAEHGEDGAEHGIIDDGGGAAIGFLDHVTGEGHDEEGPEELR